MRNPFTRVLKPETARPSLKERAASLKATAGRVMKRNAVQETATPEAPSPAIMAMVAEWQRLLDIEVRHDLADEEMSPICDARHRIHGEICAFPAASVADLAAKLPLFRDEITASEPSDPAKPTMDHQAWLCIVRDLEGVGAMPSPARAPAARPIRAGSVDGTGLITYELVSGQPAREMAPPRHNQESGEQPAIGDNTSGQLPGGIPAHSLDLVCPPHTGEQEYAHHGRGSHRGCDFGKVQACASPCRRISMLKMAGRRDRCNPGMPAFGTAWQQSIRRHPARSPRWSR